MPNNPPHQHWVEYPNGHKEEIQCYRDDPCSLSLGSPKEIGIWLSEGKPARFATWVSEYRGRKILVEQILRDDDLIRALDDQMPKAQFVNRPDIRKRKVPFTFEVDGIRHVFGVATLEQDFSQGSLPDVTVNVELDPDSPLAELLKPEMNKFSIGAGPVQVPTNKGENFTRFEKAALPEGVKEIEDGIIGDLVAKGMTPEDIHKKYFEKD